MIQQAMAEREPGQAIDGPAPTNPLQPPPVNRGRPFDVPGEAKPSAAVSVVIFVAAVALMAYLRLVLFGHRFVTLTYGLPLLICLWHKDRRLLWSMAAAFVGMSVTKTFWILPDFDPRDLSEGFQWGMQVVNIGIIALAVDAILRLDARLRAQNRRLEQTNAELAASEEEVRQQNEELQQQGEELNQQNEELQRGSEELECQADDLQTANRDLNAREAILNTLLVSVRETDDEREVLRKVCQTLVTVGGDSVANAAFVERKLDRLVVRVHAGAEEFRQVEWAFPNSFAALVMGEGRTAFLDDIAARPDLVVPEPPSRKFRSVLGTPLRLRDQWVGALELYSYEPRSWTKQEFSLLEWAASQVSLALDTLRMHQQLRASEEKYRTLFDSVDDGFCILQVSFDKSGVNTADFRMLEVNPAYEKHTGLLDAVGKRGSELMPGLQRFWFDLVGAVALTGEPKRFENYSAPLNRWFDGYVCRIGQAEDRKVAVLFKDVTQAKQFQANLERLVAERTAKLGELVAELEHFSYTITHDMRAPLRAMRAFAEMVRDECANCPAQEQKKLLDRIISAAERMDTLITDSLNYSKAGRQELPLAPVDVNKLLRGILDSYPNLQEGQADVSVESNIPPVLGNEAALTQCFSNLLGNSVKFAQPGTQAQIKIRSERKDGWMRLWVEDNGIGISAPLLPRVFEMFARGESPQAGTGIGLALVRKVVHRMGGKVGVESEPGRGSRFWLELRPGDLNPERLGTKLASPALGKKGS